MTDLIAQGARLLGALLIFVAALGALRFRDFYMRMHAASKASSLGLGLMMLSLALGEMESVVWFKAVCGIVFLFLTAPVAAHLLGRAAYIHKVPLWEKSLTDEMAGRYAPDHSRLEARRPAEPLRTRGLQNSLKQEKRENR
jgi:multicomponent Na+:H+ antiporter subunit G